MTYFCVYCTHKLSNFSLIVEHLIEKHRNKEIKFKHLEDNRLRTLNFKIIPEICREQGRTITINEDSKTLHVSKQNCELKDSPLKKILKITDTQKANNNIGDESTFSDCFEITRIDSNESSYQDIVSLLPEVIQTLKENGRETEYVSFNRLLAEKKFPMDNVAFLLFLDVVRWFSLDGFTTSMRYSEEVKLFWRTGLRLFGGRFLRFMGGPKNKGQIICKETLPGSYEPENSKVNFVVPDRRALCDDEKFVSANKPCILYKMINKVSQSDPDQTGTYKICVDGKKINPCSKGEVDLWGYEDKPTYKEKQTRLTEEKDFFIDTQTMIEGLETFGRKTTADCDEMENEQIVEKCRRCITLLSERIRDLRHLKVKKEIFLRKLMEKCSSDWKSSQFAMVISSIKTNIYQIENCLDDLLECIDSFCNYAAAVGNYMHLFSCDFQVCLQTQENYVCLGNNTDQNTESSLLKQRSEAWFQLRRQCLVTGSTINRAIGLDGLKKQKEFLDEKTGRKPEKEISADLQRMFEHGTSNEINAVSTFVAKFLPAFHPELSFYEEGCYIKNDNGESILIVSPDGSIRNTASNLNHFGVEIKCPFPGKMFSTPVHYSLPHYYVPQVLSEMNCLDVGKLYFLSYSKDSMTVHEARFNSDLWNTIFSEIKTVNQNNNPKKLSETLPSLKQSISEYCHTNVNLVAEIKSCIANPCDHSSEINGAARIYHQHDTENKIQSSGELLLRSIRKTFLRCDTIISECHKLCTQRASEVLVFMVADLDRSYKPELPHAYPIAYALKGYSMKTDIMNKMIHEVLYALYTRGIYNPVVSYDGQWAKLAFQSSTGEPLTVIELQKRVYNDVKKRSQNALTKDIFERSVVKAESFEDLLQKVSYVKQRHIVIKQGKPEQVSITTVGSKTNDQIRMSSNLVDLLKSIKTKNTVPEKSNDMLMESDVDDILSSIPSDVMSLLDDEIVTSLNTIQIHPGQDIQISGSVNTDINLESVIESQPTLHNDDENGEENEQDYQEDVKFTQFEDRLSENGEMESVEINRSDEGVDSPYATTEDIDIEPSRTVIDKEDTLRIFSALQKNPNYSRKWLKLTLYEFEKVVKEKSSIAKMMTKAELILCIDTFNESSKTVKLTFFKSWNKPKLVDILFEAFTSDSIEEASTKTSKKRRRNPVSLINSCKKVIKSFPKKILNVILSQHEFIDEVTKWRAQSPFSVKTTVSDLGPLSWFSIPEYNQETFSYIFSFLDVHHLITNCRIKVCKDGFPERKISKSAWIEVARENQTNLKVPHVEDLVDKQSDAIAKETFSTDVERAMKRLGYIKEAQFCKLIREFYEAEDEPGIETIERCQRRLNLREWLLEGVNFCGFPPCGSHIRGVPNIMFQGFLTNIDRRIQLFPYVKSGNYNVRSLGSLEIENFFGEFQDLDPKGSGVIKAEEIPSALESASQLISTRLMPNRPFHMTLSKAKVYPVHDLIAQCGMEYNAGQPYVYPQFTNFIQLRNHTFDLKARSKRKAHRKVATISDPDDAARGVAPIRQFHKCDESKILPHKRLGLELI